jgi:hypothetical protein
MELVVPSSLPLIILRPGVHSRQRFSRCFDLGIHGMADRAVLPARFFERA